MKIYPPFAVAIFGLALSGCSNEYFERQDKVTFSAGDAVAWNMAQQTPTLSPKNANNTRIVADGEKAGRTVRRLSEGQYKWFREDDSGRLTEFLVNAEKAGIPTSGGIYRGSNGGGGGSEAAAVAGAAAAGAAGAAARGVIAGSRDSGGGQ